MKNILIIGGTYFLGKCFLKNLLREEAEALAASDGDEGDETCIYVLNRGTYPLAEWLPGGDILAANRKLRVQPLVADRHDEKALEDIARRYFEGQTLDAVVDFCGYEKGDVASIFRHMKSRLRQYLFVSTVDVYRRGMGMLLDECAPYEDRDFGGEAGAYITGKVTLEKELKECCARTGTAWTILRPAVIYGPGNYAPREGMYFHWIKEAGQIIHPTGATGSFQLVYVEDVSGVLLRCLCNEKAYDKAYNVCDSKTLTYDDFADILTKATEVDFERVEMPVDEVAGRDIPLPFPFYQEESEHYSGASVKELGVQYTDLVAGMRATYKYFMEKSIETKKE
ncbi:MAG: NAD-dependent epimerase/dehydratase family protein [Lachnospiraceae bacterium]|nr:NAD-dependent epimerase/dehydratase family protein [Lachnospiraceae bacterium]